MTFVLSCLLYSFIGCLMGFFAHIFNGLVQSKIKFNLEYIIKTSRSFFKILLVMTLATFFTSVLVFLIPNQMLAIIGAEAGFLQDLIYYLIAFAAFDFGLKNE